MTLAPYVRILGRGPGRSRPLTRQEARAAMTLILNGEAEAEAIGALLMLMRFRGEYTDEVTGFVEAARDRIPLWHDVGAAVDWPSYAAGRTRGHPYFLLAAKLVAQAGYPVLLHGWNSHQQGIASVRDALPALDIPLCETPEKAAAAIARCGIAYAPLDAIDDQLLALVRLREKLGLRSIVNTVLRLLNPAAASLSVQGVFHPTYRALQSEVGVQLGQPSQCVIKGGGGEFERHPAKAITAFMLREGAVCERTLPSLIDEARRLHDDATAMPPPAALWAGEAHDAFAQAVVIGTAALALLSLDPARTPEDAEKHAATLWANRPTIRAAA